MRRINASVSAFISFASIASAQQIDHCGDVLVYSARNYSHESEQIGISVKVYDAYCEGNSEKSNLSIDSGGEAMIKMVPVAGHLNGSSTQERLHQFCKEFNSEYLRNENRYRDISQVENQTTSAWLSCEELISKKLSVQPQIVKNRVTVTLNKLDSAAATASGVTYNHAKMSCTVSSTNASPNAPTTADHNTKKSIDDKAWNVICDRIPATASDGTQVLLDDVLTIDTDRGAFNFPIPADGIIKYQFASDIQNKMAADMARLEKQESRHYSVVWDSEIYSTPAIQSEPKDLGPHDICSLSKVDFHININAESSCEVSFDSGHWKLFQTRNIKNPPEPGSTTACSAICGTIK